MIDKTFKAGEKFRPVRTETRKMQFLYDSGDAAVFMDNSSYDRPRSRSRSSETRCAGLRRLLDVDLLYVDERPQGLSHRAPWTWP